MFLLFPIFYITGNARVCAGITTMTGKYNADCLAATKTKRILFI